MRRAWLAVAATVSAALLVAGFLAPAESTTALKAGVAVPTCAKPTASGNQTTNAQRGYSYAECQQKRTEALLANLKDPAPTVTATATATVTVPGPTSTVTVTPSPTSSPTPTPSPTETPTTAPPTSTPPNPSAFPNESNTGVPASVTLDAVQVGDSGPGWDTDNGTFNINNAGTVIDGLDIPMVVRAVANNITIQNSRIRASGYYTVKGFDPPTYYTGLTIKDSEIDGLLSTGVPGIAVATGSGATYLRVDFHGFGSSGPRMSSGDLMQDSWVHGFVCVVPEHSAGSSANGGGSNIRWLHNNIDVRPVVGPNSCASNAISIYADFAPASAYNGVQMIGNKVAGGAYGIYALQNQGARNVRVEDNVFVRGSFVYGPANQIASGNGNTFTGNKYDDGTPIN